MIQKGTPATKRLRLYVFSVVLGGSLLPAIVRPPPARAAATCDPWTARVVSVQGTVEARRAGETLWQPVRFDETYCAGDSIRVGESSRADLALFNQPLLRLDQNTTITLAGVRAEGASLVELLKGALYFFSRVPRNLEVRTAFVNAGVEGTEGVVRVEADRTSISIFEGKVLATNEAGGLTLTDGQSATCEQGHAPVLVVGVRPRDAVQWALHYPPVLSLRPEEFPGELSRQEGLRTSMESFRTGDVRAALEAIKGIPEPFADARVYVYRAALLLAVGRVDRAGADLQRALAADPRDPQALALQSIVAVVQNDKDGALRLARAAVEADPKSPSALIALSYAQQARFDLEGARSSVQRAVALDPGNALAWARLAELHLSFGELTEAVDAARKSAALDPDLSRAQTVLGFADLTEVDTQAAKAAFERAIERDQADHLPRLGLGLTKIREGDLPGGGREIEIAVSLAPNNSLVRSYLGKTYFEQKRTGQTDREYAIAKELDPKDPTPWFYDAIQKQTTNRPVEALRDMETAIDLNDNRAVYRSRLLLDSDLAARSAALGRIYGDLGFQQLGLVEGWKSVNTDPSNFSAHRLLADSYAALPRHEVARVSELLQSQLLQPLNMTPIQPRLGESNLFLIAAGGPTALSFNEFNPLFNRNGIAVQANGVAGENNTYAGEGVVSGIHQRASFSIGGSYFQTDGPRTNSDQTDSIADAFGQFELSPQTSVQFEYRFRDIHSGDLQLNFFRDDVLPNERTTTQTDTYRTGVRHDFSPNSILLGSFMYQTLDLHIRDHMPEAYSTEIRQPDQEGISAELQHLFRSPFVSVTSGGGYFNLDREQLFSLSFVLPDMTTGTSNLRLLQDATHGNVYLYTYVNVLPGVTATLGASGDFFETNSQQLQSTNQGNPKFGVTWNVLPTTTLRAAAFRVLRRTLLTNQTLEPTQVAGFNQFFDDIESTDAWNYGVAIDQKFGPSLFGGVELSERDLHVPLIVFNQDTMSTELAHRNWREYLARPYIFWTPHDWLGLSAEYRYEHFTRDDATLGFENLTTHRVPLGLRFFHPYGLTFALDGTYFDQQGDFIRKGMPCCESGSSNFWVVNSGISYRLPERYGFVTFGAANLFDEKFQFQEVDINNLTMQPSRTVFGSITLAF